MTLLQRLTRPLARFFRLAWMSRLPLWPAGLSSAPARKRMEPRKPTRLEGPVACEPRETPDDILGVLTSQFALGGLPLRVVGA